jgi:hypothetical protein
MLFTEFALSCCFVEPELLLTTGTLATEGDEVAPTLLLCVSCGLLWSIARAIRNPPPRTAIAVHACFMGFSFFVLLTRHVPEDIGDVGHPIYYGLHLGLTFWDARDLPRKVLAIHRDRKALGHRGAPSVTTVVEVDLQITIAVDGETVCIMRDVVPLPKLSKCAIAR